MSQKSISTLSTKRIIRTSILFLAIPLCARLLDLLVRQYSISLMAAFNLLASFQLMYDWNLFGIHYNRAKKHLFDTLLYVLAGVVIIFLLFLFGAIVLHANIVIPEKTDLIAYGYARIGMLAAYSYMQASAVSLTFKAMTDRLDTEGRTIQSILLTGLGFGLLYTIMFLPEFNIGLLFTTYFYNILLMSFLSFLYNRSDSIIPGMAALGTAYLLIMILSL